MLIISEMDNNIKYSDKETKSLEKKVQKDLIELEKLCLELGNYVKEHDEYLEKTKNEFSTIDSVIQDSESSINKCEESIEDNRKKIFIGIGFGTILGLISTGSIIFAPITGIATGYFGYKILK